MFVCLFGHVLSCFETERHFVAQARLVLPVQPRMALALQFSCPSLPRAGITGVSLLEILKLNMKVQGSRKLLRQQASSLEQCFSTCRPRPPWGVE